MSFQNVDAVIENGDLKVKADGTIAFTHGNKTYGGALLRLLGTADGGYTRAVQVNGDEVEILNPDYRSSLPSLLSRGDGEDLVEEVIMEAVTLQQTMDIESLDVEFVPLEGRLNIDIEFTIAEDSRVETVSTSF